MTTPCQTSMLADSPNGLWPMDDGAGATSARDISGHNLPFTTINSGVTPGAAALPGSAGAFSFNGSATAFLSGVAAGAFHIAPFSWEAFILFSSTANAVSNFFNPSPSSNGTWRLLTSSGQLQYNNSGSAIGGGGNLFGAVHQVGIAIDGSGNTILIVDGVQVASFTGVASVAQSSSHIGAAVATLAPVGRMANFASYPTALSAARFLAHYQATFDTSTDSAVTVDVAHNGGSRFVRTTTDALVSTDIATRSPGSRSRSASDLALLSDAATGHLTITRQAVDSAIAIDVVVCGERLLRVVTDAAVSADGAMGSRIYTRTAVDSALANDIVNLIYRRTLRDWANSIDSVTTTYVPSPRSWIFGTALHRWRFGKAVPVQRDEDAEPRWRFGKAVTSNRPLDGMR